MQKSALGPATNLSGLPLMEEVTHYSREYIYLVYYIIYNIIYTNPVDHHCGWWLPGWGPINGFLVKLVCSIACLAHAADVHTCALHTCACLLMSHPRDSSTLKFAMETFDLEMYVLHSEGVFFNYTRLF